MQIRVCKVFHLEIKVKKKFLSGRTTCPSARSAATASRHNCGGAGTEQAPTFQAPEFRSLLFRPRILKGEAVGKIFSFPECILRQYKERFPEKSFSELTSPKGSSALSSGTEGDADIKPSGEAFLMLTSQSVPGVRAKSPFKLEGLLKGGPLCINRIQFGNLKLTLAHPIIIDL